MARTPGVCGLATLLTLIAAAPAQADETPEPAPPDPFTATSMSGVTFGAAPGVSTFFADAGSQLESRTAPSLHAYGGYRFSNGLSPELVLFHTGSVSSLSPGLRWSLPIDGRFRPWVAAHAGVDHVTLTSSDTRTGGTYWSIDGGVGLDIMIVRALSFELGGDLSYANAFSPLRPQPIPAGSAAREEPSGAIDWLTLRAGFGIVL